MTGARCATPSGAGAERLDTTHHDLLNKLRRTRYRLWRAWELKERLRDLYRVTDPADARTHLTIWCTAALRSRIPQLITLARRIRKHFDGIIAAVEHDLSNSRLEGINSKIRLINRRAHGHRTAHALAASIYLCLGGTPSNSPHRREKGYICLCPGVSPSRRAFEDLERLRRSIAMLSPGQPALDREDALNLLAEMQQVRRDLDRLENGLRRLVDSV